MWVSEQPQGSQQQPWAWGALCSWPSSDLDSSLPWTTFPATPTGPFPWPPSTVTNTQWLVRVYMLNEDQPWDNGCQARHPAMWSGWLKGSSLLVRVGQNVGPLEKGMANHFGILALRTPWTVWKDKKIWHWKMSTSGCQVSNILLEKSRETAPERMKRLG